MFRIVRVVLAVAGGGLFVLGLLLIGAGGEAAAAGIGPLITGGVLLVAVVLEHQRYRSAAAERVAAPAGPGGGEPQSLPPAFRPTDERFVDPATGLLVRVHVNSTTGERRYLAEGQARTER